MADEKKCEFKVVPMSDNPGRFVIIEVEGGVLLDDAQGYGYKTARNAYKAGWYKFNGGRGKLAMARDWWKSHREFAEALGEAELVLAKECASGKAFSEGLQEIAASLAAEFGITDFKPVFLRHRPTR